MGGSALKPEDAAYEALLEYFQSISSPSVTSPNAIAEVLENEAASEAAYSGGDPARGAELYAASLQAQ